MKRFKTALPHPMLYGLAIAFAGTASAQESATQVRNSTLGLEEIVVTAGRSEARRGDIAQQMELITADKLALTPAGFITDSLKKSASVDIIQYPGGLSGIGLRGFRPQFSGINQQVLVLIDGRPAGATSLGTLPQASIQRIEVIKGSSSSVYGASAMGGVVNFLTSDSEGPIGGEVAIRAGDFGTLRGGVTLGGSLTERISFDLGLEERSQRDDFRMGKGKNEVAGLVLGDGKTRPSTSYQTRSAFSRLGVEINEVWSADLRTNLFMGRDVEAPGAESDGTINQGNRDSDAWSGDFRINGSLDKHKLQLVAYTTSEQNQNTDVTSSVPRLSGTTNETRFNGFQISDAFRISDTLSLVAGIDLETIEREGSGRNVAGTRIGPTSPDESRDTTGAYLDLTARLLNERLILNAGVRSDRIESTLKATPLRADLKPGSSKFETVNPRAGAVFYPFEDRALRLHASIGEGFVPPAVRQIAGSSESRGTGGQSVLQSLGRGRTPDCRVGCTEVEGQRHIVGNCQVGHEIELLENVADVAGAEAITGAVAQLAHRGPQHVDTPPLRGQNPCQKIEKRALSRARRTVQEHSLPASYLPARHLQRGSRCAWPLELDIVNRNCIVHAGCSAPVVLALNVMI